MARLTATVAVLFFLFAFSNARTPLDLPENGVVHREQPKFSPESDAKPTLLLPSQKQESDPTNVVQPQHHTDIKDVEITEDLPAADARAVDVVPLLKRPIHRHFPPKRPDHFRHPRRGCHHGINPKMNPQVHRREISYGDGMILAGESKDFNTAPFRGGGGDARDIPEQGFRFQFHHRHHRDDRHHHRHHHDDHHHEGMPRFPFRHHDMSAEQRFRKPFRGEEEGERDDDGFMRGLRKFLDHFN